jgi:homogentisate 1,2-dioxygenase
MTTPPTPHDAPGPQDPDAAPLPYQSGFGNEFATEAVPGALPQGRNSPQRGPLGLYAELLSGTAFTAPRALNRRSWLYRRRPSVAGRSPCVPCPQPGWVSGAAQGVAVPPMPLRWHPFALPDGGTPVDFIDGIRTLAVNGDVEAQAGAAVHVYLANASMGTRALVDADGDLLLVPQQGRLHLTTEMGRLHVAPGEIALLPRGMAFKVDLPDGPSRGYALENHGAPFALPELGPIGSNGLANARDFLAPVAAFEPPGTPCRLVTRSGGRLWAAPMGHSPFDVVAWHGNLAPVKYDTARFMALGSISFDHPDPSIFTVLTSPSGVAPGTANCDFVIFPPRWLVAEDTFRPPWFHRNTMSEFMGLVHGRYDARSTGFQPGGASLHNGFVPHGPDTEAFERATAATLQPQRLDGTLAFMFESRMRFLPTRFALDCGALDTGYAGCWQGLDDQFAGPP